MIHRKNRSLPFNTHARTRTHLKAQSGGQTLYRCSVCQVADLCQRVQKLHTHLTTHTANINEESRAEVKFKSGEA